jgi:hypothetical protein
MVRHFVVYLSKNACSSIGTIAVFLDKDNNLKLGDFGLSKAMAQAAMTQTYVGVCSVFLAR